MKITKSATFAVIPHVQTSLDAVFLWRLSSLSTDGTIERKLEWKYFHTPWPGSDKSSLIDLLTKAGLTVRFYDEEHKQWMEQNGATGSIPCEGNRDGTWTLPDLPEFETGYLKSS